MRTALLGAHVVAGTAALLLAVALLAGRGRWTGRTGATYVGTVLTVAATATALVGPGSGLPTGVRAALLVVAAGTAWAAVTGRRDAAAGRPGARRRLDASVVSLVTAVAVVSAPAAVWVLVAVAGTAVAELAQARRRAPVPAA